MQEDECHHDRDGDQSCRMNQPKVFQILIFIERDTGGELVDLLLNALDD